MAKSTIHTRLENMFETSEMINSFTLMFIVNRLQVGYVLIIFPKYLANGYNIWIIILAALISQMSIYFVAKWLNSSNARSNFNNYQRLFPPIVLKVGIMLGISVALVKFAVLSLGYLGIIQLYLVRDEKLFLLFLLFTFVLGYLMSYGISSIFRFSIIAFLFSFWLIFLLFQFYYDPSSSFLDLLPIWSDEIAVNFIDNLVLMLSAFSGPELLIFAGKWLKPNTKVLKYMTLGNALTLFEYLFIFIATVLFFTPHYLIKVEYPIVNMIRYITTPLLERLEIFYIPLYLFPIFFSTSLLLISCFYGILILFRKNKPSIKPKYFFVFFIGVLGYGYIIIHYIWTDYLVEVVWVQRYAYISSAAYILFPFIFMLKKGVDNSEKKNKSL